MTAVSLPNTIEIIYDNVFYGCSKLETVKIPSSVTTIGKNAFYGCSSLKSLIIEDGDTEITHYNNDSYDDRNTFSPKYIYYGRNATTSYYNDFFLNLGNNNESVQVLSFGPKVSYVAPVSFPNLKIIYCMNEEPASKGFNGEYFGGSAYANAVLYVPTGSKEKYASNYFWGKFFNIQEMDINNMWRGIGDPNTNNTSNQKCKKPTISYHNGKLLFDSVTSGVSFQYSISDSDIKTGVSQEVALSVTYNISVYATKAGFENSDVATATLCWIDANPKTEGMTNGVANVRANAVLIQNDGSTLKIDGAEVGSSICIYNMTGHMVGSAKVLSKITNVNTSLRHGEIGIVKIGEKSIKVLIK